MSKHPRFDIHWHSDVPRLDYHFCRSWDEYGGCYGTRSDHGYSFDEAKAEMIKWHEGEAERWRSYSIGMGA